MGHCAWALHGEPHCVQLLCCCTALPGSSCIVAFSICVLMLAGSGTTTRRLGCAVAIPSMAGSARARADRVRRQRNGHNRAQLGAVCGIPGSIRSQASSSAPAR